jgi:hypothetical protein
LPLVEFASDRGPRQNSEIFDTPITAKWNCKTARRHGVGPVNQEKCFDDSDSEEDSDAEDCKKQEVVEHERKLRMHGPILQSLTPPPTKILDACCA